MIKFLKLKVENSTSKKLEQVFSLMEELKINLIVRPNGDIFAQDLDQNRFEYFYLQDIEGGVIDFLPPTFEYKILVDNPQYLEEAEKEKQRRLEEIKIQEKQIAAAKADQAKKEKESLLSKYEESATTLQKQISKLKKELNEITDINSKS